MSEQRGSNSGLVAVVLTPAQRDFLITNCNANIASGPTALNTIQSRDLAKQIVELIENFKAVKQACADTQTGE